MAMKFGERLKQARTDLGFTQEVVARELHVSRQTISSWENERSYPDIASLVHLSDYYQLSLDILLKEDNSMVEEISRKEELAKINKIWGLSYVMNLVFLMVNVLGVLIEVPAFTMGTGVKMLFTVLMLLNISLLLYTTTEKNKLSKESSKRLAIKGFLFKGLIVIGVSFLLLGVILLMMKQAQAMTVLGVGTGMTVGLVALILIQKYLIETN